MFLFNHKTPPPSSDIPFTFRPKSGDHNDYSIKAADFDINGTGRVKIGHEFNFNIAHHGDQINHIYHGEPPTRTEVNFMRNKTKAELQKEFIEAIRFKKSRRLALALEVGADPDLADDKTGRTPLMEAVRVNNVEAVKLLLSMEVNLETVSGADKLTVMSFAAQGNNAQLLRLLKDHGASVGGVHIQSWSPLHSASSRGGLDAVDTLLELGADPNHQNSREENPLMTACRRNWCKSYPSIVKSLLKAGSRTDVKNVFGYTPLDIVIMRLSLAGTQLTKDMEPDMTQVDPADDWEVLQYLVEATRSSMLKNTTKVQKDH